MHFGYIKSVIVMLLAVLLFWEVGAEANQNDIMVHCEFFDKSGRSYGGVAGRLCLPFPSGQLLSANGFQVTMRNRFGDKIWQKSYMIHHSVSVSSDHNFIYAIQSRVHLWRGEFVRFDALIKMDMLGNILQEFDSFDHIEVILNRHQLHPYHSCYLHPNRPHYYLPWVSCEFTHVNAIYEVPANAKGSEVEWLKPGNIIVTFNQSGFIAVLDKDFRRIIKSFYNNGSHFGNFHDAQVMPSGNILFFNNNKGDRNSRYSSLEEIDGLNGNPVWFYTDTPKGRFNAGWNGTVQLLDNGNFGYCDLNSCHQVTRAGEKVFAVQLPFTDILYAKFFDLKEFLKNYEGF